VIGVPRTRKAVIEYVKGACWGLPDKTPNILSMNLVLGCAQADRDCSDPYIS